MRFDLDEKERSSFRQYFMNNWSYWNIWETQVNEVSERRFPESNFDLAGFFIDLLLLISEKENNAIKKALAALAELKKLMEKYKNNLKLFKNNLLENDNLIWLLKDKIDLSRPRHIDKKILFDECSKITALLSWWNPKRQKGQNDRYSVTELIMLRIAWVYHALTGEMPDCGHNGSKEGTAEEFSGDFYEFLLEIKPLLKLIGIDLVKETSLGEYLRRNPRKGGILKQYRKILSDLNIKVPTLQE